MTVLEEPVVAEVESAEPFSPFALEGPDGLMLEGIDTSGGPLFSVSEMASFFFARSPHWVRWLESCHFTTGEGKKKVHCTITPAKHTKKMRGLHEHTWRFVLDGELLMPLRTKSNARKYDLALVEKIAHALARNGTINGLQLHQALTLVKVQAEMFGYLGETGMPEHDDHEDNEEPDVPEES